MLHDSGPDKKISKYRSSVKQLAKKETKCHWSKKCQHAFEFINCANKSIFDRHFENICDA